MSVPGVTSSPRPWLRALQPRLRNRQVPQRRAHQPGRGDDTGLMRAARDRLVECLEDARWIESGHSVA